MGDRVVKDPPGICWSAYSDAALLESIKTIATELQSRANARASGTGGAIESASATAQQPVVEGSNRLALKDEKEVAKTPLEWY